MYLCKMKNNAFRTEIQHKKAVAAITHNDSIMLIGSCFAENIGAKLTDYKFHTAMNPFGILFNPASIAQSLDILTDTTFQFAEEHLHFYNNEWFSFFHHGKFSHTDKKICLDNINTTLENSRLFLNKTHFLIITLGSAMVYSYQGNIVANCHKLPQKEFDKSMLEADEISSKLLNSIRKIKEINPKIQIILTVSPVRYIKYDMVENTLNKANLIVAVHQLIQKIDNSFYFPAYEIMMDELRDYRFYADDMIHPSPLSINYIWEKFAEAFFDKSTLAANGMIHKILLAKNHRMKNPNSGTSRIFKTEQIQKIRRIQYIYPTISFKEELNYFSLDETI